MATSCVAKRQSPPIEVEAVGEDPDYTLCKRAAPLAPSLPTEIWLRIALLLDDLQSVLALRQCPTLAGDAYDSMERVDRDVAWKGVFVSVIRKMFEKRSTSVPTLHDILLLPRKLVCDLITQSHYNSLYKPYELFDINCSVMKVRKLIKMAVEAYSAHYIATCWIGRRTLLLNTFHYCRFILARRLVIRKSAMELITLIGNIMYLRSAHSFWIGILSGYTSATDSSVWKRSVVDVILLCAAVSAIHTSLGRHEIPAITVNAACVLVELIPCILGCSLVKEKHMYAETRRNSDELRVLSALGLNFYSLWEMLLEIIEFNCNYLSIDTILGPSPLGESDKPMMPVRLQYRSLSTYYYSLRFFKKINTLLPDHYPMISNHVKAWKPNGLLSTPAARLKKAVTTFFGLNYMRRDARFVACLPVAHRK
jgi:hypothetical protein